MTPKRIRVIIRLKHHSVTEPLAILVERELDSRSAYMVSQIIVDALLEKKLLFEDDVKKVEVEIL